MLIYQFLRLCIGAGIRPPLFIIFAGDLVETFITGPYPKRPPKLRVSPSFRPIAGITLTAVVFELIIPIAASSAIIALITSGEVSPGMIIISRPTEHTEVIASSFSMVKELDWAAKAPPYIRTILWQPQDT